MDHVCACKECDPVLAPPLMARLGPRHFGVRFGTSMPQAKWWFEVNGVAIPEVIEGVVGAKGWVYHNVEILALGKRAHICKTCQQHICCRYTYGYVRAWRDGTEMTEWPLTNS